MACHPGSRPYGKNKALLLFGKGGLPSSVDMVSKAAANLVFMNILRASTLIFWSITTELSYSFSAVHPHKSLLI